jgi:ferredoxin
MTEGGSSLDFPIIAAMARELERVHCVINGKEIYVWEGYRLWDAALDADARLWHWCGGIGQCTTCAVIPISGAENLTPATKTEKFSLAIWFAKPLAFIRRRWKGKPIRLACQSYVRGPVEVAGLFGKRAKEARDQAGIR